MTNREGKFIRVNKPEWYQSAKFVNGLNDPNKIPIFTWHKLGEKPNEYSDVVLYYEQGCGSFDDLPASIAQELYQLCEDYKECLVWISNVE